MCLDLIEPLAAQCVFGLVLLSSTPSGASLSLHRASVSAWLGILWIDICVMQHCPCRRGGMTPGTLQTWKHRASPVFYIPISQLLYYGVNQY
jgi:hypothetical protein